MPNAVGVAPLSEASPVVLILFGIFFGIVLGGRVLMEVYRVRARRAGEHFVPWHLRKVLWAIIGVAVLVGSLAVLSMFQGW